MAIEFLDLFSTEFIYIMFPKEVREFYNGGEIFGLTTAVKANRPITMATTYSKIAETIGTANVMERVATLSKRIQYGVGTKFGTEKTYYSFLFVYYSYYYGYARTTDTEPAPPHHHHRSRVVISHGDDCLGGLVLYAGAQPAPAASVEGAGGLRASERARQLLIVSRLPPVLPPDGKYSLCLIACALPLVILF